MTSFEMTTERPRARPFRDGAVSVLLAPFKRLLQAQRDYLAIQHLKSLKREQLDDIGLERSEIEAAVHGRLH